MGLVFVVKIWTLFAVLSLPPLLPFFENGVLLSTVRTQAQARATEVSDSMLVDVDFYEWHLR